MVRVLFSKPVLGFLSLSVVLLAYQNCSDAEFDYSNGTNNSILSVNDQDGDGLSDDIEIELGTSPNDIDSDDDGLPDGAEVNSYGTDPTNPDTDGGGTPDGQEVLRGTNPVDNPSDDVDSSAEDNDGDGLSDDREKNETLTDPMNPDTDADGLKLSLIHI